MGVVWRSDETLNTRGRVSGSYFLGCIEQDGEKVKPAETELVLSDYPELFEKDVIVVIENNASGIED